MTKEEFAAILDGREYPFDLTAEEKQQAKAAGFVVVYGASDDLMEFDGAFREEIGAYNGAIARIDGKGLLPLWNGGVKEEEAEEILRRKPNAREIKAIWCDCGYSWLYETDIPHVTFEVLDEGDKYCRGMVFNLADL